MASVHIRSALPQAFMDGCARMTLRGFVQYFFQTAGIPAAGID